jgi:hypothetical protein
MQGSLSAHLVQVLHTHMHADERFERNDCKEHFSSILSIVRI